MDENKRKHLEFIQNVIARMNTNSFFIKGWVISLVAALFALAAKDSDPKYVIVTYLAITTFWILDGFYVSQERQYRNLYDMVRAEANTDFSMDAAAHSRADDAWLAMLFSRTLLAFYVPMVVIALVVMFVLQALGK